MAHRPDPKARRALRPPPGRGRLGPGGRQASALLPQRPLVGAFDEDMYIYTHTRIYMYIHMYIRICIYVYVYVHMYMYRYTCMLLTRNVDFSSYGVSCDTGLCEVDIGLMRHYQTHGYGP